MQCHVSRPCAPITVFLAALHTCRVYQHFVTSLVHSQAMNSTGRRRPVSIQRELAGLIRSRLRRLLYRGPFYLALLVWNLCGNV